MRSLLEGALNGLLLFVLCVCGLYYIQYRRQFIERERARLERVTRRVIQALYKKIEGASPACRRIEFSMEIDRFYGWLPWQSFRNIEVKVHLKAKDDRKPVNTLVKQFMKGKYVARRKLRSFKVRIQIILPPA